MFAHEPYCTVPSLFLSLATCASEMPKVTDEAINFELTESQTQIPTLWCHYKDRNTATHLYASFRTHKSSNLLLKCQRLHCHSSDSKKKLY